MKKGYNKIPDKEPDYKFPYYGATISHWEIEHKDKTDLVAQVKLKDGRYVNASRGIYDYNKLTEDIKKTTIDSLRGDVIETIIKEYAL
jgi:uncharacterized protein with FMN-binding domain